MELLKLPELTNVTEALNPAQRQKLKLAFKKSKKKRALSKKKNAKKISSKEKLTGKAGKKARSILEKKILKGKDKSELSFAQRASLEKKLEKKKGAIKRIAKKEFKNVKKDDKERVKKAREKK